MGQKWNTENLFVSKDEGTESNETSVSTHPNTRHIPEAKKDFDLQQLHYENNESRKI
jgi:hypothetical protein